MQVNLDPTGDEAYWFDYDEDPNLELLIAPLTPLIDDECTEKGFPRPPQVNGRFHRAPPQAAFKAGPYMRAVFVACVKGWRAVDPTKPALTDTHNEEIPYSAENKRALSTSHSGLVRFGYQMAQALGDMSVERVREERERFRGVVEASN